MCDHNLPFVAILRKKLKIFVFSFSTLFLLFPKYFPFSLGHGFPIIPNLQILLKAQKVIIDLKTNAMNQKLYFSD